MNPTWINEQSNCPHCDAGLPHYGPTLHIEPDQGFGWRFVSCMNTPDCLIVAPEDEPAYKGETMQQQQTPMLSTTAGRVIGALALAGLVFLAVAFMFQQQ